MSVCERDLGNFPGCLSRVINFYARKYEGHGAERDDLVQEGYLAALRMRENRPPDALERAIDTNLRGLVRDASEHLRRRDDTVEMSYFTNPEDDSSWLENCIADEAAAEDREGIELNDAVERSLDAAGRDIVAMLLAGFTQKEIGRKLGITKQGAKSRINTIRKKLRHMREMD